MHAHNDPNEKVLLETLNDSGQTQRQWVTRDLAESMAKRPKWDDSLIYAKIIEEA